MKKLFLALIVLFLFSIPVLAQDSKNPASYFQSYLENGELSIYASIGFWWGLCASVGAEIVLGQWNIADILPIDFSVGVRALYEGWSALTINYYYAGAAPMFILHLGVVGNLDFYEGIGLGFYFSNSSYLSGFGIGFAAVSGAAWYLSSNLALILEYAYVGYVSTWGVGISLKI